MDHSAHTMDHTAHTMDHSGHTMDHSGHADHSGHTMDHSDHGAGAMNAAQTVLNATLSAAAAAADQVAGAVQHLHGSGKGGRSTSCPI